MLPTDAIDSALRVLGLEFANLDDLKPGELASKLEAAAGQGLGLASQLPDGPIKAGIVDVLKAINVGANAFARVGGGLTFGELTRGPALYASGSGIESVEAQLRAEASDPARYPAPAGPYEPPPPPPPRPAKGDDEG